MVPGGMSVLRWMGLRIRQLFDAHFAPLVIICCKDRGAGPLSFPTLAAKTKTRCPVGAQMEHPGVHPSFSVGLWLRFAKGYLVAEGVQQVELVRSPKGLSDARTPVGIVFGGKFGVEFADAFECDLESGAGRAVAVMLGEWRRPDQPLPVGWSASAPWFRSAFSTECH
jgi:hypothetical protein